MHAIAAIALALATTVAVVVAFGLIVDITDKIRDARQPVWTAEQDDILERRLTALDRLAHRRGRKA